MPQNFLIGNKTKVYFTILPDALYDEPVEPQDVILTTSAIVTTASTSVAVSALSGPVPRGTPLTFKKSGSPDVVVFTTASAKTGDTSIEVEETTVEIASDAVANYKALLLLVGGTTADEAIQSNDTETMIFGDELNYSTGVVTGASWTISYQCNVLPVNHGYLRLAYAATYAVDGVLGWVKKEDQAPKGYTKGDSISGVVSVLNLNKTNSAESIVTASLELKGRGSPIISRYS
jgi:hypothetical protein